jgi:hypothetical protein
VTKCELLDKIIKETSKTTNEKDKLKLFCSYIKAKCSDEEIALMIRIKTGD